MKALAAEVEAPGRGALLKVVLTAIGGAFRATEGTGAENGLKGELLFICCEEGAAPAGKSKGLLANPP